MTFDLVETGSVTLTGGPATGLAFAPLFEEAGVEAAATIAVATAMGGIVLGGAPWWNASAPRRERSWSHRWSARSFSISPTPW